MKKLIDKKLLIYLTLFYTLTVAIDVVRKSYLKVNEILYTTVSWSDLFTYNIFLDWVVVIVFMVLAAWLTKRMFERNLGWKTIIAIHLFLSFFIGYFIFFLSALIAFVFNDDFGFDRVLNNMSLTHFMSVVHFNFLIYFSMIGIVTVYYYIKKVKNIELQRSKLQSQLATAKLNALKSQLHPHFMFNTLNSISSLIEVDIEKAQNLIADFGDLFRSVLEFKEDSLIPLEKELLILDKYLDIISVRFSDHLDIIKEIKVENPKILVPSMLIQPIIENAVKHGYSYNKTELEIKLILQTEKDFLKIVVENNGQLLNSSFDVLLKKSTGLKNTYERLHTLYNKNFEFEVANKNDNTGVRVIIKIPID